MPSRRREPPLNAPAEPAAIGFTVKSGWACAVLVAGPLRDPRAIETTRVEISDPDVPDAKQPYHAGFGTARGAGATLERLVKSVRTFGGRSVAALLDRHRAAGHTIAGAGLVVGSLIDPATIANDHIRIHALEGQLFRGVVHDGAVGCGLPCTVWRERDLYATAAETLERPESELRATMTALGKALPGPWRAEHKAAAMAAWLVLARPASSR